MASLRGGFLQLAGIRRVCHVHKLQRHTGRLQQRFAATYTPPATEICPSFWWRAVTFVGTATVFTTAGFIMAPLTDMPTFQQFLHPPSDAETLKLFVPATPEAEEAESFINSHPVVTSLRADPAFTESRPHMKIPPAYRPAHFMGGTLLGPGRLTVAPFAWADATGTDYVQIMHLGTDMCGHAGVVHGGLLATLLDEGLARGCFAALPHHIGMTASLTINYLAPTPADTFIVLRAHTKKVEGRKAWVEGRLETLVGEGEKPVVLATAEALYISPKQAATMAKFIPAS